MAESFATPLHRSQARGGCSPLVAPRAREEHPNRSGVGSLGLAVPLVSFDPASSDQRDGARESAHQRELALRAVAAVGADRHLPEPQRQSTCAGSSSGELALRCRGAMRVVIITSRHAPHSSAPLARRPTVRAVVDREAVRRQARRHDARPHSPHRPRGMAVPFSGRSGQPRVDSTTTGHRCWSTRGYHAWTKRITVSGRQLEVERERAVSLVARDAGRTSVGRPTRRCSRSSACWHDRPRVKPSIRPSRSRIVLSKRTANESRHLRPVLVGEPAGRIDR